MKLLKNIIKLFRINTDGKLLQITPIGIYLVLC